MENNQTSYSQILKASSTMGFASALNMLFGFIRMKFAAIILGVTGVGILSGLTSIQSFFIALSNLGIQSSSIRELSFAISKNDNKLIGDTIKSLKTVSWFTGILGLFGMPLIAPFLSQFTFGNLKFVWDISALGIVILFTNLSGAYLALLQSMRKLRVLAKITIFSSFISSIAAVILYYSLGIKGVVPSLICISIVTFILSWKFSKQIHIPISGDNILKSISLSKEMIKLGFVFMWNVLLGNAIIYAIVALLTKYENIQSVGYYTAAFSISGMFVNFILNAMASDYYPKLTGVSEDFSTMNVMVNNQIEIGILMALSGLIATISFSPLIIEVAYNDQFMPAIDMVPWFILGCFGRIVSWPMGYIILSLARKKMFFITESFFSILHLLFVIIGILIFGLKGVAIAFFSLYLVYTIVIYIMSNKLTGFSFEKNVINLIVKAFFFLLVVILSYQLLPLFVGGCIRILMFVISFFYCLRILTKRLGPRHFLSIISKKYFLIK